MMLHFISNHLTYASLVLRSGVSQTWTCLFAHPFCSSVQCSWASKEQSHRVETKNQALWISEPFTLIQLCRNLQPEQELWGNCSLPSPAARYAILFSVEMFIRICAVGPVAYFCSTGLVNPPGLLLIKVGWSFWNFEKYFHVYWYFRYFLLFPGKCLIGEYPYPDVAWVHSSNNG